MQKCRDCQKDIDKKAKKCPYCQSKQGSWFSRHPILTGIFAIIIFISVVGALADDDSSTQSEISPSTTETREAVTDENDEIADELEADEVADDSTQETVSQKSAIRQANSYIRVSGFSRSGLIEQLEFGGFSNEDATYAVDKIDIDWNQQAARQAESYMNVSGFSRSGLIEQLEFVGFTNEQANYGADSVGL